MMLLARYACAGAVFPQMLAKVSSLVRAERYSGVGGLGGKERSGFSIV